MKLASVLCALFLLLPLTSQAYFTTDQQAVRVTDDTVLYTITYTFGFEKHGLYMPIMATRNEAGQSGITSYTIMDEDEETDVGISNAIVLTGHPDIEVQNNQYYLKPGQSAAFTLVAFLTIPEAEQADLETSLLMTHLPFTRVIDGENYTNQLNPSELQYYRTPVIEWD